MALAIDWLGIAEGSASDARGAVTLVGVGQTVVIAPSLPHKEARAVMVVVLDDDGSVLVDPDSPVALTLEIRSPSDKLLLATTQTFSTRQAINPAAIPEGVPTRGFQLVMSLNLEFTEYGPHTIKVSISVADNDSVERIRRLYVVPPAPAGQALAAAASFSA